MEANHEWDDLARKVPEKTLQLSAYSAILLQVVSVDRAGPRAAFQSVSDLVIIIEGSDFAFKRCFIMVASNAIYADQAWNLGYNESRKTHIQGCFNSWARLVKQVQQWCQMSIPIYFCSNWLDLVSEANFRSYGIINSFWHTWQHCFSHTRRSHKTRKWIIHALDPTIETTLDIRFPTFVIPKAPCLMLNQHWMHQW